MYIICGITIPIRGIVCIARNENPTSLLLLSLLLSGMQLFAQPVVTSNGVADTARISMNESKAAPSVKDTNNNIIINKEMLAIYKRYMEKTGSMDYGNYVINFRELSYADNATTRKVWDVYLGLEAPDSLMLASNLVFHIEKNNSTKDLVFPLHPPAGLQSAPPNNIAEIKKIVTDTVSRLQLKPAEVHQKREITLLRE